jgi:hypothetical protein
VLPFDPLRVLDRLTRVVLTAVVLVPAVLIEVKRHRRKSDTEAAGEPETSCDVIDISTRRRALPGLPTSVGR